MNQGKLVFAQLMEFAPYHVFKYCVKRYDGDYKVQDFTCWKQFLCMAFGQLTHRESLSDTTLCLKLQKDKLYHLGIGEFIGTLPSSLSSRLKCCMLVLTNWI